MSDVQMPAMPPEAAEVVQPDTQVTPQGEAADGTGASEQAAETEEQLLERQREGERARRERAKRNQQQAFERLQRERDEFKQALLEQVRTRQQPEAPKPQNQAPSRDFNPETGRPFDSYDEFLAAQTAHIAEKKAEAALARRLQEAQEHFSRQQQEQYAQQVIQGHAQRVQEYAKADPEFAKLTDRDDIEVPPVAAQTILQMQNGPAILKEIGKNPAIADHLARMGREETIAYLGELSGYLRTRPPQITKAPPPGQTVGGRSDGTKDPRSMTRDEYYAHITRGRGRAKK